MRGAQARVEQQVGALRQVNTRTRARGAGAIKRGVYSRMLNSLRPSTPCCCSYLVERAPRGGRTRRRAARPGACADGGPPRSHRRPQSKTSFFQQNGVGSCSNFSTFIGHTAARPRAPRARGVRSRGRPHRVHVAVAGWRAPGRLLGLRRLFLRIRICGGPRCVISIRGAARAAAADAPFARARGGVRGLAGREQAAHGMARAMADF